MLLDHSPDRSAWEVTVSRPERDGVLAHQDPLPPAAADTWLRLVREYRRAKAAEGTWTMPEVARHLADALESARVPHALGGALAYGYWAPARGTLDVDLNLFGRTSLTLSG